MRRKIAALIIDPHKAEHDYSQVTIAQDYEYGRAYGEKGFDINVLTDTSNILSEINKFKGADCIITIGKEDEIDFVPMNALSFEFRKKWIHREVFNPFLIARDIIEVFLYNINRERPQEVKLFSCFTCTFNTPKKDFERLYNSLCNQTYPNWNWYILDDSTNPSTSSYIEHLHDPRIVLFKNVTNHGVIGFNKNVIAMACDGDYLVEIDHDDELTPDCLAYLLKAFSETGADFVYSDAMEEIDGREVDYGDKFAYGLGAYRNEEVLGVMRRIALTPYVNAISVRGIHALPNHVRCWEKKFYHNIGGHNKDLSVLDDMDILIRTFLKGKMCKVDKVLYIQHEGTTENNRRGSTTQAARFDEIQRTNDLLRKKYDKQIHKRLIELTGIDPVWINDTYMSDLTARINQDNLHNLNDLVLS